MDTIDLFLKATDKCLQLLTVRSENRRKHFVEVIEPLFRELEPVVDDYMSFFNAALAATNDAGIHHPEKLKLILELGERRRKMWQARTKVRALAAALKKSSVLGATPTFAMHIAALFESPSVSAVEDSERPMSRATYALEQLSLMLSEDTSVLELRELFAHSRASIEKEWFSVAVVYAQLRLDSLR